MEDLEKELMYALNRMENAGQSTAPAVNGYGEYREEYLARITAMVNYINAAEAMLDQIGSWSKPAQQSRAKFEAARIALGLYDGN
jgi:hypothetical protein